MDTARMEAFSDGVIAVALTIMVLGQEVPKGTSFAALLSLAPQLLTYVLSFIYVGIYWNNHHHLLKLADRVSGGVLWANLHLLFWLTLVPLTTGWMKDNLDASLPAATYGVVLLLCGFAYYILGRALVRLHGRDSVLARAIGGDRKTIASVLLYALAITLAFVRPWMAYVLYVVVAILWLVPDRASSARCVNPTEPAARCGLFAHGLCDALAQLDY